MRNLPTTKDLRKKVDPDEILNAIDQTYQENLDKLRSSIGQPKSPLLKYERDLQISLLESSPQRDDELIDNIASKLKDTVYFLSLPKKDRTHVTQRMRSYHSELVQNQLVRINLLLEDTEIGSPKHGRDPTPKHKGMHLVREVLSRIKKDLEIEKEHWDNLSRAGYLTGLQNSMGDFFVALKSLGMKQKDQITLVQKLFDDFNVDWEEGDRENIRVSLQQSALANYDKTQRDIRQIPSTFFSKSLSEELVTDLVDHARIMKKRLRRF